MSVAIIGGGLAGAAAGAALARSGVDVTIIERERARVNKICGEFLSTEAQAYLRRLGLDLAALGGHPITHLRLVKRDRLTCVKLPFQALGLSRRTLDEALLNHAAAAGAKVLRGHAVRGIVAGKLLQLDLDQHAPVLAQRVFLATGKHDLRGQRRHAAAPALVGFKMYFALAAAQQAELAGHIELIMLGSGYAGLQMIEAGQANLCLLLAAEDLRQAGGKWSEVLAMLRAASPHLARRLADATPLLEAPLTIARVPYGYVHKPDANDPPGLFRLGDQAAVIQSFTGDGMSIALHSAALAADFCRRGQSGSAYHQRFAHDVAAQVGRAGAIYRASASPLLQPALFSLARLFPAALRHAARLTRVPPQTLLAEL